MTSYYLGSLHSCFIKQKAASFKQLPKAIFSQAFLEDTRESIVNATALGVYYSMLYMASNFYCQLILSNRVQLRSSPVQFTEGLQQKHGPPVLCGVSNSCLPRLYCRCKRNSSSRSSGHSANLTSEVALPSFSFPSPPPPRLFFISPSLC